MSSKNLKWKEANVEKEDDVPRISVFYEKQNQEIVRALCWLRCTKGFCETALLAGQVETLSLSCLVLPIINPLPLLGHKDDTLMFSLVLHV